MENKIIFDITNAGPMTAYLPDWMKEKAKELAEKYSAEAVAISEQFKNELFERLNAGNVAAGYAFTTAEGIAARLPRLVYESTTTPAGERIEITIDLLKHTIYFDV